MPSPLHLPVRWGILGAGHIARKFAADLLLSPDCRMTAVASRSLERAAQFAAQFGITRRHGHYQGLADDPEVDVVYVATPHAFHADHAILCLRGGRSVLCEKPFALNRARAEEMAGAAQKADRFLMEAMWTRFMPHILALREAVRSGAVGEIRTLTADFGFRGTGGPESRLLSPALGGGALLDVGIYPVTLAFLLFGRPQTVKSVARIGGTGVDEQCGILFGYDHGGMAVLSASVVDQTAQEAVISGTGGRIVVHAPWWRSGGFTVHADGREPEKIQLPIEGNGFVYEIAEVVRCLRDGKRESEIMPLSETLAVMSVMDGMRKAWGMEYPGEW
jgi:dihydrodiol dehydrogenase / D-xylose 1-dehydrogenase (NADP)